MTTETGTRGPATVPPEKLNVAYHVVLGVAAGVVSILTFYAWPFAILTGIVIGKASSDRRLGRRQNATVAQFMAVAGGVLAMLLAGFLIGGLVALLIVG